MKQTTTTCDCGCKATTQDTERELWFTLTQVHVLSHIYGEYAKIERDLHFKNLECLGAWTTKASKAVTHLHESARSFTSRGRLKDKNVEGLYV